MLLSPRKNGLTSLFKEVRVFKERMKLGGRFGYFLLFLLGGGVGRQGGGRGLLKIPGRWGGVCQERGGGGGGRGTGGCLPGIGVGAKLFFFRGRNARQGKNPFPHARIEKPQTGSFVTGSFRQALATRSSSARQTFVSIIFVFAILGDARQSFCQTLAKRLSKTTRLECTCLGFPERKNHSRLKFSFSV